MLLEPLVHAGAINWIVHDANVVLLAAVLLVNSVHQRQMAGNSSERRGTPIATGTMASTRNNYGDNRGRRITHEGIRNNPTKSASQS